MGDYWVLTVETLQNESNPIVDKPKLQEKYLTKPPFRYLHDIITAVQSNAGFAPGLYSGEELDAKAIQDKDAKVNYLQKIIDVVGLVLNEHVPAKPLKIVAGLEPENTNVFLQMLGSACRVGNGADAVQRVLRGENQPGAGGSRAAPAADRPSSRPSSQQPEEPTSSAPEAPVRASPSRTTKRSSETKESKGDSKAETKSRSKAPPPEESAPAPKEKLKSRSSKQAAEEGPPPLGPPDSPAARASDPAPSDDPMRKSLMRPQSARKAPPKPGAAPAPSPAAAAGAPAPAGSGATGTSIAGGGGGGSGRARGGDRPLGGALAPNSAARPVSVMEEGAGGNSDDDVEVVHEAVPVAIGASNDVGERGVLVKNIMDAEKNLKKAGEDAAGAGEEAGGTGIILGKRLGKAGGAGGAAGGGAGAVVRTTDTTAIKEMVQKLCQSSHPLAKSMDYLQEDLENMAKEYRFWQVEKRMFGDKLAGEQRLLGDSIAAETQLADLDGQVKQVRDRILGIKAQLLRNDDTINKLLSMAVGR